MTVHSSALPNPQTKPFLNQTEAAAILDVSVRTAGNMLARGEIDAVKVGNQWRIPTHKFLARFGLDDAPQLGPTAA